MGAKKMSTLFKAAVLAGIAVVSINVCSAHTSFSISLGAAPVYYGPPAPVYYAPAPVQTVTWIPAHMEYGYWVPGHYVEYVEPVASPGMVWMGGGYYHHHRHWHYY